MSLRKLTPIFRLIFVLFILAIAVMLLFKGASDPIAAQQTPVPPTERQIENTIPKHVPIDVKLTKKKEKNWKDLKNENWAQDFELEITNTGDRPIYAFYLLVLFDVPTYVQDQVVDDQFVAPIRFGRAEIHDPRVKPKADDVPIKPSESMTFKIHPNQLLAWDKNRGHGRRSPTKAQIKLEWLNFGDGTGLVTNEGVPFPRKAPTTVRPTAFTS